MLGAGKGPGALLTCQTTCRLPQLLRRAAHGPNELAALEGISLSLWIPLPIGASSDVPREMHGLTS